MKNQRPNDVEGSLTLERRAKILEILEEKGQARVNDLSSLFGVSEVTIRNDFDKLEEKGLLIRTRGGGIRNQRARTDYQLSTEATHHLREKQLIGKKAAALVGEKDTLLMDVGTTTLEVARNLTGMQELTVITNALNIAGQFMDNVNIKVIVPGGALRNSTVSLIGPIAEDTIRNLYCDKMFLGANGVDSRFGISKTHIEDAHLNRLMMSISREVILVVDSSKFLKRSFSALAPVSGVHKIVTDSGAPEAELRNIEKTGVEVIIADNN